MVRSHLAGDLGETSFCSCQWVGPAERSGSNSGKCFFAVTRWDCRACVMNCNCWCGPVTCALPHSKSWMSFAKRPLRRPHRARVSLTGPFSAGWASRRCFLGRSSDSSKPPGLSVLFRNPAKIFVTKACDRSVAWSENLAAGCCWCLSWFFQVAPGQAAKVSPANSSRKEEQLSDSGSTGWQTKGQPSLPLCWNWYLRSSSAALGCGAASAWISWMRTYPPLAWRLGRMTTMWTLCNWGARCPWYNRRPELNRIFPASRSVQRTSWWNSCSSQRKKQQKIAIQLPNLGSPVFHSVQGTG